MRTISRRNRPAFTLFELLVACFVLGTGVLALASTSVAVARLTGDAARAGVAVERGQARMEAMRAGPCVPASGTTSMGGISEWWSATLAPEGQALSDSVQYPEGARHDLRTDVLSSGAWCP
ncbi:MAG: prepilin-type N-terminal cleavage/methylation domain-containing protein [Gemmatimonadota bacterium]